MFRKLAAASFFSVLLVSTAFGDQLSIGVSVPLTGDGATYGTDIHNVLEFANDEIAGGKYKLIFEDDKCNGLAAASAAQKLVNVDKVKYVLGPACSGAVAAAAPIYEKGKVVVIAQGSSPDLAKAGDYIFRTFPNDALTAEKLAEYVKTRHKKFAVLTEDTEYCRGLTDAFVREIGTSVGFVSESFLPGSTDFRSSLLKFKSAGFDGIFINTQAERGSLSVLKQYRDLGLSAQVYSAYWASSPTFLEAAGTSAEGIIIVDLPNLDGTLNPRGAELLKKFLAKYKKLNSTEFVFATTMLGFEAMHQSLESKGDVRTYLYNHKFSGILDSFFFNPDGDIQGVDIVFKEIKNGKPVLMNETSP